MTLSPALAGGLAGTLTVASLHEAFKSITANAPRMDLLDIELLEKGLQTINVAVPEPEELQKLAVAGELICDTLYYGLTALGSKKNIWFRGTALGLFAGVTAVILPKTFGLTADYSSKTTGTKIMTISLYLLGGVVAAAVTKLTAGKKTRY